MNNFLATELKRGPKKTEMPQNDYLGGVKAQKMGRGEPDVTRRRIEAPEV